MWTLIAVAVRIAKALGLHLDPDKEAGASETFFDQQMRRRLWLTICLMDLQASFGETTEPLVGHEETASSLTVLRNINDSDFDTTTTHEVPDREELTDTTFALVTYHAQLGGRLLNFSAHEDKSGCGGGNDDGGGGNGRPVTLSTSSIMSDREARQQHVRRFEQRALGLLHFCDPESSPFAWFTWHGTQCLVAGMRLSALCPVRRARAGVHGPPSPPRMEGDTELLRLTLRVLEKAQLMHTDPRGEGFRWYVTIPWLALATAIAECYVCADTALLRRAWPLVEASYQHHEAVITRHSGETLQGPLPKLMRQTREKLAALLHGGHAMSESQSLGKTGSSVQVLYTPLPTPVTVSRESSLESTWATADSPTTSSDRAFEAAHASSAQLFPQQMWDPTSLLLENHPMLSAGVPTTCPSHPPPSLDLLDSSWRMEEEFMSTGSFNELATSGLFVTDNTMGGC